MATEHPIEIAQRALARWHDSNSADPMRAVDPEILADALEALVEHAKEVDALLIGLRVAAATFVSNIEGIQEMTWARSSGS